MTTRQANQRLMGDFRAIARDAEELMKATAGEASGSVAEVRRRLAAALQSAKATYDDLEDKTVTTFKATDRCIRDHPYETVGVALALGLLVGVLALRR